MAHDQNLRAARIGCFRGVGTNWRTRKSRISDAESDEFMRWLSELTRGAGLYRARVKLLGLLTARADVIRAQVTSSGGPAA
jgi:hypothetical protein